VQTLLDNGADAWQGILLDQYYLLLKLKAVTSILKPTSSRTAAPPTLRTTGVSVSNGGTLRLTSMELPSHNASEKSSRRPSTISAGAGEIGPIYPFFSVPQISVAVYRQANRDSRVGAGLKLTDSLGGTSSTPTPTPSTFDTKRKQSASSASRIPEQWSRDKYILPVAFAVASGNKPAFGSILWKMKKDKPAFMNSGSSIATSTSTLPAGATGVGNNSASSIWSNQSPAQSSSSSSLIIRDSVSLLIQQDSETTIHLLKTGVVDLYQRDPRGANSLHLAVRSGNLELVTILLHFDDSDGTLLNCRGENGWTGLHEAISRRQLDIYRYLLRKGAKTDVRNDQGDTPQELGQKMGLEREEVEGIWNGMYAHTYCAFVFSSPPCSYWGYQEFCGPNSRLIGPINKASTLNGPADTSSTIMPGSSASEFLHTLDQKLLDVLYSTGPKILKQRSRASSFTKDGVSTPPNKELLSDVDLGSLPIRREDTNESSDGGTVKRRAGKRRSTFDRFFNKMKGEKMTDESAETESAASLSSSSESNAGPEAR
jgi:hypothetical protein